jgi:D-3-phosphoglycerate dehydrogenase / 2-oxoglutarate reductase
VLGAAGINITQMHNASRVDYAYNLIDADEDVGPQVIDNLKAIDGVLSVRVI